MKKLALLLAALGAFVMIAPVINAQGTVTRVEKPDPYNSAYTWAMSQDRNVVYSVGGINVLVTRDSSRTWQVHSQIPNTDYDLLIGIKADSNVIMVGATPIYSNQIMIINSL